MVFKSFRSGIILRTGLLIAVICVFAFLIQRNEYLFSSAVLGLLILIMISELIFYIERTNRRLRNFLDSIRYADFSSSFSENKTGKSFNELDEAFNNVIVEFKKHRTDKEEQYNYLNTVVEHISAGLIAFNEDGKIKLYNMAAAGLLGLSNPKSIQDLIRVHPDFPNLIQNMDPGDKSLLNYSLNDEMIQLSIHATRFKLRQQKFTLISIQNIHAELEEKEVESWQKLIRVLTHEMMNSITPISSLAGTINDILLDKSGDACVIRQLDEEDTENICNALQIIGKRSQGLLNFVELYRNLTRIPKPVFQYFELSQAFENIQQLLSVQLKDNNIRFSVESTPSDLRLLADPDLLDQVLINLIMNAIDACKSSLSPHIHIKAFQIRNNRCIIEVSDNGTGITEDIVDKIFIPFFTSKPQGSGIGLSLARQIMHLHRGKITAHSKPGKGTVFTLYF
ncbi:MAG: HAMP domain-containing sensor histidine kinase [Bacteroidales bacterium]|nr:HAMP domain-containing sensor histidine kinase [Bacteroidales bacterium]